MFKEKDMTEDVNEEMEAQDQEATEEQTVSSDNSEAQEGNDSAEQEAVGEELSTDEWKKQLEAAEKKADENHQKYLRAQADLDNYRRRTRKEKEEQAKYASLSVIEQLLPVLDNFERAIASSKEAGENSSIIQGVEMVFRQLEQVLQNEGVEEIPTIGVEFDPNVHQAVMQVESDEYASGVVADVLQKGYKLKDKVVRPAMVKVSN